MTPEEKADRIGRMAHHIWEAEGRPDNQALRHWAMAERLVDAELQAENGTLPGQPDPG